MKASDETYVTPIYILSGFLGSGKTTLLAKLIDYWQEAGLKPAVIMNELGDVNLDGLLVKQEVPMEEMLGGCICCSIRGDLGVTIHELIQKEHPDLIVVEATGAANPMELLDGVTETALYMKLDIRPLITVVDSAYLMELFDRQQGKTYRLMQEQIRCASVLILNKTDLLDSSRMQELLKLLNQSNPYAKKIPAVKCEVDLAELLVEGEGAQGATDEAGDQNLSQTHSHYGQSDSHNHNYTHNHSHSSHSHDHSHEHSHDHGQDPHGHDHHHTHSHVMVHTHYLSGPVDSKAFEQLIAELPRDVYRAKGVLTFSDTSSRFLFQYAYREPDFMKITPQGDIPDVVVFIGEHFDKEELSEKLKALEAGTLLAE
ncbi:CobW family GTP-binding protein [Paenibacillus physcomitrellae]|uniref:Cobalamin biosynthesis protein n=1 Tax=Paenibacillus physcomitrellae TaxID=1619311 RepID=A0ABQ1G8U9_9BACL|nr:GTP-binding protein [Paenibacillus physcomitrellae]GGA39012.1 cobalamin biosynthesis protein [Paenibacillus physcomitrellae]